LTTAHTDTPGDLAFHVTASGADPNDFKVPVVANVEADTYAVANTRLPAALGANGNLKADVRDYNGVAGTFSGGRPEVRVAYVGGVLVDGTTGGNWVSFYNNGGSAASAVVDDVGTVQAGGINSSSFAIDSITAAALAASAASEIAAAVRDVDNTTPVAGGIGDALNAVKGKTVNLPSDPADASDVAAAFSTVNGTLATIAGYIDTEVAAIKAKTDNLPPSPAAVGSAMTLADASITSAKFAAAPAETAAPGDTDIVGWLWWLLSRFGRRKTVRDATTIKVKRANGTSDWTNQGYTASGSDETVNGA
jgi:hypothetical protein